MGLDVPFVRRGGAVDAMRVVTEGAVTGAGGGGVVAAGGVFHESALDLTSWILTRRLTARRIERRDRACVPDGVHRDARRRAASPRDALRLRETLARVQRRGGGAPGPAPEAIGYDSFR